MLLNVEQAMQIYQAAIDTSAGPGEGSAWWEEVKTELEAVIAAPTNSDAAHVIAWWHTVWKDVGDTPTRAARRIRTAAARVLPKSHK
jgi:hypothetical protein